MLTDAKAVWNKISSGVLTGVKEVAEGKVRFLLPNLPTVSCQVESVVEHEKELKRSSNPMKFKVPSTVWSVPSMKSKMHSKALSM